MTRQDGAALNGQGFRPEHVASKVGRDRVPKPALEPPSPDGSLEVQGRSYVALLVLLLLLAVPASVNARDRTASEPRRLDKAVLSRQVTGPGFSQVYKDEDHEPCVLGKV